MFQPIHDDSPAPRLVIILSTVSPDAPEAAVLAFRYAATAAAMDVAVEVHAISGGAVRLFGRTEASEGLLPHIQRATEQGASMYVCPLALTEQGMCAEDLIEEVAGVRGAASLISAGFMPRARFITF